MGYRIMNTLSAQEARKLVQQATTRKITDASKLNTIMKNIAKRANAGFTYYDYQPSISYNMAKTLIHLGYRILRPNHKVFNEMVIDDFIEKQYGKRISWGTD